MRRTGVLICMAAIACTLPSAALTQTVCGDANGNGYVNLLDVSLIQSYITMPYGGGHTLAPTADCDDRAGITIGDMSWLVKFLFGAGPQPDCTIQRTYTFPQSLSDTVFLPFMAAIPDELDSVRLPIVTSFAADTRAFYIAGSCITNSGPGQFDLKQASKIEDLNIAAGTAFSDTIVVNGCETDDVQALTGRHTFFEILYERSQAGVAGVSCNAVARSELWRISIERGGDLYTPVIEYYEVPLPHSKVTVAPAPLAFVVKAGLWSTQSHEVTFTSDIEPVSFNLAMSDDWIVIESPSPSGYTTPATIMVQANASALTPGDYAGQILFTDVNPSDAEFIPSALDINLTVKPLIIYPPGDLNCDGHVSLGDITLLIDCLFITVRPLPVCE